MEINLHLERFSFYKIHHSWELKIHSKLLAKGELIHTVELGLSLRGKNVEVLGGERWVVDVMGVML